MRLVFWLLHPLGLHRIRKRCVTKPVSSFRILSLGLFNPPPHHRRVLPVLRYPRHTVIYHYPLIGVIFMVVLLIFIIQNYPIFFSNYYPKFTIRVIYPFIFNLGEFQYELPLPQHYPIVREEKVMLSCFCITFLIEIN